MNEMNWCKDKRKGLKLTEPSENLSEAYFEKAEDSLAVMNSLDSPDWIISTGYYSMYYSLYAVLMKVGVKSEIHICTIAFMKECLRDFFSEEEAERMDKARLMRVQSQYSVTREFSSSQAEKIATAAPLFLLKCRDVCDKMTHPDMEKIRKKMAD
ncbi:uncharacterized protein (UPF0332 family) [Methanomicrobium sp. W14]|uniref:HEPN domain-containing protein n=1 Tax=Methanomicrobium sp. W14 TaxID=2817839 RepID=UPI001AE3E685|nr:HEPN domain-containing protein [Methanomicrobium sp. W14]MBP2133298.1 uncharacterized protein (UPF0332 family) [Methanomicrobium sp. W14]